MADVKHNLYIEGLINSRKNVVYQLEKAIAVVNLSRARLQNIDKLLDEATKNNERNLVGKTEALRQQRAQ